MNLKKLKDNFTPSQGRSLESELNSLLAEEFLAWYQYFVARPFIQNDSKVLKKFIEFGTDELDDHAAKLQDLIQELGLEVKVKSPQDWLNYATTSYSEYKETSLEHIISVNIDAENQAIDHYISVIEYVREIGNEKVEKVLTEILTDEEEHLKELTNFNSEYNKII